MYYIYALLPKTQNNYSLVITGVRYYQGSQITDDDIVKNFSISENLADFSINPGFIVSDDDFFVTVQNLKDTQITLNSIMDKEQSDILYSGEIKRINFELSSISSSVFKTAKLSTENLNYEIPVYIFTNFFCGDNKCNGDENCTICTEDCGNCTSENYCGDSECNMDESCLTCSEDCGNCTSENYCGDNNCSGNETCESCSQDCGECDVIDEKIEEFKFEPSKLEINMSTNSEITQIFYIHNTGELDLNDITLSVSTDLKPYIFLSET